MKLTVTTFVTLDGVQQGPGGAEEDASNGFDLGGWLVPYVDAGFGEISGPWMDDADAFLLGRRTYDLMKAHWPNVTDPADTAATKLNTLPKYIATSRAEGLDWSGSHRLDGDLARRVAELKEQPGRTLQVHGSGKLVQFLLRHSLVDELRLLTFPVVLGKGQRLFEPGVAPGAWRLIATRPTEKGVIGHTYAYEGKPALGAIVVDAQGKEELVTT
ncbi:hypothetical protein DSC45_16870 [Streptomyces sp. YIM 130001]|uniref:dihydrofolate reductase family protein n=1 Tax=Streptomyces sp. YIM 130001 TaxID=2259644 RepID=UPI000E65160B|nr:dihydrofolate reductase family protein [Streptomyces sp. YIM 130001]RII15916.1 hypothetical protein DSC45_16870 [Streptomyces sp. YIM 130001]